MAFLVCVVCGLAGIALAHVYLRRLEAEVSGGPRVSILVAAEDLAAGTPVSRERLAVREVPRAYVERRHVRASDLQKVLGARIGIGLESSHALLWTDLSVLGEGPRFLSGLVPSGMRALALDERSADFDGLLRPGDRVDVLLTTPAGAGTPSKTSTLVQNLLVLAVGDDVGAQEGGERGRDRRGASVALSTTLEQAPLLTQAKQLGRLSLTLRNPGDITLIEGIPEVRSQDIALAESPVDVQKRSVQRVIEHVR